MLFGSISTLIIGFGIDLLVGDPRVLYHPVRFIGLMIDFFEKVFRKLFRIGEQGEKVAGYFLLICVVLFSMAIPLIILIIAYRAEFWIGFVLEAFMCYQIFATKALKDESMKVYEKLREGDLQGSRFAVSMIVGRDTDNLDFKGITKATVETIAENTADGVIAPLFYMIIGGPVLGFAYKAVNTLDSMVGYKNKEYINFGRASARFDDVVNYIPARISACIMIFSSWLAGFNCKNAYKIYRRDRYNHKSPNSAQTEAVVAGALEIELAGDAMYFGELYKKPKIGDPIREIEALDIKKTNRLLYLTAIIAMVLFGLLKVGLLVTITYLNF